MSTKRNGISTVILTSFLVVANLIVANLWMTQVKLRWDLTEDKRFEIASGTENIVKRLRDTVNIKCYVSGNFPKQLSHCPRILIEKLDEYGRLNEESEGAVVYTFADPDTDPEAKQECEDMGIGPGRIQELEGSTTMKTKISWFALVFRYGDRKVVYNFFSDMPGDTLKDPARFGSDLEFVLSRAIRNVSSPRKTVGLLSEVQMVPSNPSNPRSERVKYQGLSNLEAVIARTHDVKTLDLAQVNRGEPIPSGIEIVVLWRPKSLTDVGKYVIDQFLMNGGNLLCMVDSGEVGFTPKPKFTQYGRARVQDYDLPDYKVKGFDHGLDDMLAYYGVRVEHAFVQDFSCYDMIYYTGKDFVRNMFGQVQVKPNEDYAPYFSWPVIPARDDEGTLEDPRQLGDAFSILSPNDDLVLTWASPITVLEDNLKRHEAVADVVLRTGPRSWVKPIKETRFPVNPAEQEGPGEGVTEARPVAVLVRGRFQSFFRGKDIPSPTGTAGRPLPTKDELEKSRRDVASVRGALLVVGDADFCSDQFITPNMRGALVQIEMGRARRKGSAGGMNREALIGRLRTPLFFVSNCVDVLAYGEEAEDLFQLQHRTFRSRRIKALEKDDPLKDRIQLVNMVYLPGAVILLGLLVAAFRHFRCQREVEAPVAHDRRAAR